MKRAREYITPNDIQPSAGSPLPGAFSKTEAECAAALIVYYLQAQGVWAPFSRKQLAEWAVEQVKADNKRVAQLLHNPFARPDRGFFILLDKGWVIPMVEEDEDGPLRALQVTDEFILRARLSSMRLKPSEHAAYAALETLPIGPLAPT